MNSGGVAITGASSGIGAAVAVEAARRGARALFLCGRNAQRLEATAAACRAAGCATAETRVLDVTDAAAVADWLAACDAKTPLDAVFANAGVGTGREDSANVRRTVAINVNGSVNTVLPAIDLMRARGAGRIVITASVAGYAPLATCPSYAGTKAFLKNWGLSLRGMLAREGVSVHVVCPGFVRSRITERNTCPMPFLMDADRAARIIWDRLERNAGLIAFPAPMRLATWLLSVVPWRVAEFVSRVLPAKNAENRPAITL